MKLFCQIKLDLLAIEKLLLLFRPVETVLAGQSVSISVKSALHILNQPAGSEEAAEHAGGEHQSYYVEDIIM